MKIFVLTNQGLEKTAKEEIKELLNVNVKINSQLLEFSDNKDHFLKLFYYAHSLRRICLMLDKHKDYNKLNFKNQLRELENVNNLTFKVEVENIKGNDQRLKIAKVIAGKVFNEIKDLKIDLKLDLKKPDFLIIVYCTGKEYYLGISGQELDSRSYRVFTNSSSFKGDYAYYLLKKSGFNKKERLLSGFMKDGTLAIEAALYNQELNIQNKKIKYPLFKDFELKPKKSQESENIVAFDESLQNFNATKKNAILAGIKNGLKIMKISVDELDVKFEEDYFDRVIFQITKKDEDKLNEIYYQASYILKKKGTLLLISRTNFVINKHSKFKLLKKEELIRGESKHQLCLLEKI